MKSLITALLLLAASAGAGESAMDLCSKLEEGCFTALFCGVGRRAVALCCESDGRTVRRIPCPPRPRYDESFGQVCESGWVATGHYCVTPREPKSEV